MIRMAIRPTSAPYRIIIIIIIIIIVAARSRLSPQLCSGEYPNN